MVRHVARVRVRYAETDQMRVVYYGRYFDFFEQARADMLRTLGLPYAELEASGVLLPVIEATARYLKSAGYDDMLAIETTVSAMPAARIRIDYRVRREGEDDVLVEGHTVHMFLNADTRRPMRVPPALSELLEPYFRP